MSLYTVQNNIKLLHPWLQDKILKLQDRVETMFGFRLSIYETLRTAALQNYYYHRGKSTLDGYRKKSLHQIGLAVDTQLFDTNGIITWEDQDWDLVVPIIEGLYLESGHTWKRFKDSPHIQPNKENLKKLLKEIK